jgi:hypothetical protein
MQIQINTDSNIEGNDRLAQQVEAAVRDALDQFSAQITRVEVHLSANAACWRPVSPAFSRSR